MAVVIIRRRYVGKSRGRQTNPRPFVSRLRRRDEQAAPAAHLAKQDLDYYALVRSVTKTSFYEFVRRFWHTVVSETPVWNWHIEKQCAEIQSRLELVFAGKDKESDLVYNQPPGTTKSLTFSVFLTAWAWTRMPAFRSINASYGEDLALELARKARMVVQSELYRKCFPEIQLSKDQSTKHNFVNTLGGQRLAVGSKGGILGFHAHCIVIDDPLNPKQAVSEAELEQINNWITGTLLTRKVSATKTVVFLVMQRLHQDDPSARMVKKPRVVHFCFPATTEYVVKPAAYTKYYKDGLFDPVQLPRHILREKQLDHGDYDYAGQFGQDPVPAGGGKFLVSQVKSGPTPGPNDWISLVNFWDKAASTTKKSAYTAGVKLGLDKENRVWLLNVERHRLDSYSREKLIRQVAIRDGNKTIVGLEQEPGSGGKESAERTATRTLMGFRVKVVRPHGDKMTRADPYSVQVNMGNLWTPDYMWDGKQPVGWLRDYLEEMKYWPHSTYKDQIDASAGAFTLLWQSRTRIGGLTPSKDYSRPRPVQY